MIEQALETVDETERKSQLEQTRSHLGRRALPVGVHADRYGRG